MVSRGRHCYDATMSRPSSSTGVRSSGNGPPSQSPFGRAKVREILRAAGIEEADVYRKIRCAVFPWYARAWDNLRLLAAGDPFTAENGFVHDLADCSSHFEIEAAFFDYNNNPLRRKHLGRRMLGLVPRRTRVLAFYHRLKAPRK